TTMKTPITKATTTPLNGSNGSGPPPFGPIEIDPEWLAAQERWKAALAAEDTARNRFHELEAGRKTPTDQVAGPKARLGAAEAEVQWVEAHANRLAAERERDAARQRVIKRRTAAWENEYAKALKALADALQAAAEVNARAVAVWEQAGQEGVRLDVYHWSELMPGSPNVYTKIQA